MNASYRFYGCTCAQVLYYIWHFPEDSSRVKALVCKVLFYVQWRAQVIPVTQGFNAVVCALTINATVTEVVSDMDHRVGRWRP